MLLVNRCKPLNGEAVGDADKRRPDPSVDKRDSALDQASCNDIPGRAKAVENGEDLMAGWVVPPASADRLAGDLLCKIRHRPASRLQYHPPLTHPSQRIHENRIQPRGRGPDYAMGGGPNGVRAPDELGCLYLALQPEPRPKARNLPTRLGARDVGAQANRIRRAGPVLRFIEQVRCATSRAPVRHRPPDRPAPQKRAPSVVSEPRRDSR